MIKAADLAALFEEIIGTPYVLGKSDPPRECDCSGAFVWAYRKYRQSIAHGSNTIYRKHCGVVGSIGGDASRLRVGMAAFKQRFDGEEPAQFRGDGVGNLYHIGLVTSVNPLRIVHATTPIAKVDASLGQWSHYGWLDDVDYAGDESASTVPVEEEYSPGAVAPVNAPRYVRVVTPDGNGVRAREEPSFKAIYKYTVPDGTVLQALADKGDFWKVHYLGKARYVDKRFVAALERT